MWTDIDYMDKVSSHKADSLGLFMWSFPVHGLHHWPSVLSYWLHEEVYWRFAPERTALWWVDWYRHSPQTNKQECGKRKAKSLTPHPFKSSDGFPWFPLKPEASQLFAYQNHFCTLQQELCNSAEKICTWANLETILDPPLRLSPFLQDFFQFTLCAAMVFCFWTLPEGVVGDQH